METNKTTDIKLIDTTLIRKSITQTYKLDIDGVIVYATHLFEYDIVGEYYYEDIMCDVELDNDTQEEIRDFINNNK